MTSTGNQYSTGLQFLVLIFKLFVPLSPTRYVASKQIRSTHMALAIDYALRFLSNLFLLFSELELFLSDLCLNQSNYQILFCKIPIPINSPSWVKFVFHSLPDFFSDLHRHGWTHRRLRALQDQAIRPETSRHGWHRRTHQQSGRTQPRYEHGSLSPMMWSFSRLWQR